MKKRILSVVLSLCIACGVLSMAGCGGASRITLNVYNWGEYIDTSVISEFEKEAGVKVNYTTYASNEEMYAKVSSGAASYDVVIPSDYMIGKMIEEDMLAELDFANIPNYQYIGDDYKGLEYDPQNKYSVPFDLIGKEVDIRLTKSNVEVSFKEGCLSLPGIYEDVIRHDGIRLRYLDENFEVHEEEFTGIRSRIIQHEYDHLEGHVHVDRIAPLRKTLLQGKLRAISEGKCDADYRMIFPKKKRR